MEKALANDAGVPGTFVVLVVVAALTVTLAGVQSMQAIVATFLALVLTITVHPLRARLARRKLPEWAASLITLLATYLVILAVCLMLLVSLGRLAACFGIRMLGVRFGLNAPRPPGRFDD